MRPWARVSFVSSAFVYYSNIERACSTLSPYSAASSSISALHVWERQHYKVEQYLFRSAVLLALSGI